jgi:hypothetical protein
MESLPNPEVGRRDVPRDPRALIRECRYRRKSAPPRSPQFGEPDICRRRDPNDRIEARRKYFAWRRRRDGDMAQIFDY